MVYSFRLIIPGLRPPYLPRTENIASHALTRNDARRLIPLLDGLARSTEVALVSPSFDVGTGCSLRIGHLVAVLSTARVGQVIGLNIQRIPNSPSLLIRNVLAAFRLEAVEKYVRRLRLSQINLPTDQPQDTIIFKPELLEAILLYGHLRLQFSQGKSVIPNATERFFENPAAHWLNVSMISLEVRRAVVFALADLRWASTQEDVHPRLLSLYESTSRMLEAFLAGKLIAIPWEAFPTDQK